MQHAVLEAVPDDMYVQKESCMIRISTKITKETNHEGMKRVTICEVSKHVCTKNLRTLNEGCNHELG